MTFELVKFTPGLIDYKGSKQMEERMVIPGVNSLKPTPFTIDFKAVYSYSDYKYAIHSITMMNFSKHLLLQNLGPLLSAAWRIFRIRQWRRGFVRFLLINKNNNKSLFVSMNLDDITQFNGNYAVLAFKLDQMVLDLQNKIVSNETNYDDNIVDDDEGIVSTINSITIELIK